MLDSKAVYQIAIEQETNGNSQATCVYVAFQVAQEVRAGRDMMITIQTMGYDILKDIENRRLVVLLAKAFLAGDDNMIIAYQEFFQYR